MEPCQRCKEEGHDRRTLWMACFYEMGEMGLPFERMAISGTPQRFSHTETLKIGSIGPGILVPKFEPIPDAKESLHKFFTLRVCKDCRADWMRAIQDWFRDVPERESEDEFEEGAAYVRELGTNRKMTPEEIEARRRP